jgi:hypothetical protein
MVAGISLASDGRRGYPTFKMSQKGRSQSRLTSADDRNTQIAIGDAIGIRPRSLPMSSPKLRKLINDANVRS